MNIKDVAISAAKEAGALLKDNLDKVHSVEFKGAVDLVTEMDKAAEDIIVSAIRENFPNDGILTEESAETVTDSPRRWIIDPLDGTTNYAHGFPIFCVSIAIEEEGDIVFGIVYAPMLDELFTAEKGKGAYLNGNKIRISAIDSLDRSLLATGFPYDIRTSSDNNLNHFSRFAVRAQAIRRAGAAALDLSYVGCGRFDGFWEKRLQPWDVAAACLVVTEAGGRITGFDNSPFSIYDGDILATNALIHDEMVEVLAGGATAVEGG